MFRKDKKDKNFFFVSLKSHITQLLDIPRNVRSRIWIYMGFEETSTLRLVCSEIKEDIDTVAGISSAIDSMFEDFAFHCRTAIRKATILELLKPPLVEFLKYPLVLEELVIKGEISKQNFLYIMKSCPNLKTIHINFNNTVLEQATPMFPLPEEVWNVNQLKKLNTIMFSSNTCRNNEISYVQKNIYGVIKEPRFNDNNFIDVNIQVHHKFANIMVKEITAAAILFTHKHMATLKRINLTLKDKDLKAAAAAIASESPSPAPAPQSTTNNQSSDKASHQSSTKPPSTSTAPVHQPRKSLEKDENQKRKSSGKESPKTLAQMMAQRRSSPAVGDNKGEDQKGKDHKSSPSRRGTGLSAHLDLSKENTGDDNTAAVPEGEGEANVEDETKPDKPEDELDDVIVQAFEYISKNPWPKSARLQQVVLALPLRALEKLSEMIAKDTKILLLNLEGYGGTHQNWPVYCAFLKRFNPYFTELITFHYVNYTNDKGNPKTLDFSIFKRFENLKRFAIFGLKKDDYQKLSRVKNIRGLGRRLEEVIFERVLLTAFQAYRFVCCYPDMLSVTLEYWSISDRQFGYFLLMLMWTVRCDCTRVVHLNLVETKIRFTNERDRVRGLQNAIVVSSIYRDEEDTRLFIDTENRSPEVVSVAPAIAFEKITPPQPKPKREKKQSSGETTGQHHNKKGKHAGHHPVGSGGKKSDEKPKHGINVNKKSLESEGSVKSTPLDTPKKPSK